MIIISVLCIVNQPLLQLARMVTEYSPIFFKIIILNNYMLSLSRALIKKTLLHATGSDYV